MTSSAVASNVQGILKTRYAPTGPLDLIADEVALQEDIPFQVGSTGIGLSYNVPLQFGTEQGFSYSAFGNGPFPVISGAQLVVLQASVTAPQVLVAGNMDYDSFFRSGNGPDSSYGEITRIQLEAMIKSAQKRTEISLLYGTDFLAKVATSTTSGSNRILAVTAGDWAGGIWQGSVNATLDFWESGGTTKVNTNAVLTIVSIDPVGKTVTVSGNGTDLSAISTYVGSNANVGGLVFAGTGVTTLGDQEMFGLKYIIQNTSTLFGISATTYDLWQGNTYNVNNAALTFVKVQTAVANIVSRGLKEDLVLYVNPGSWANILSDQAALRMYDTSYSSGDLNNGAESLTFYSQNGKITIRSHIYVKESDAFLLATKHIKRIGSTDWTLGIPGTNDGDIYIQNQTTSGWQYRGYASQQPVIEAPAKCSYLYNIVPY